MSRKLYFVDEIDDCGCYTRKSILEMMKEQGFDEVEAYEAKADKGSGYFSCVHFGTTGEVGYSDCGKSC